ncbi:MAG: class I SAM-dependent methyltransferase [Myxococcota bacterium]
MSFLEEFRPQRCAELGVWKGTFSASVLKACASVQSYYMIDPWRPLDAWKKPKNLSRETLLDAKERAIEATEFAADRRTVLQGTTLEVMDRIPDGSLDFVYVDGDHTLRGMTLDLISIIPKLKPSGVLAGDDLSTSLWQHGPEYEPSCVFPFAVHFAEAHHRLFVALPFEQYAILPGQAFRMIDTTGRYADVSLKSALALPWHKKLNRSVRQRLRVWRKDSSST